MADDINLARDGDEQPPEDHDNAAHTADFITSDDVDTDALADDPHGNEAHTADFAEDGTPQPPEDHALGGDIHEDATLAELSELVSDDDLLGASDEASLSVASADDADRLGGQLPGFYETPNSTGSASQSDGFVEVMTEGETNNNFTREVMVADGAEGFYFGADSREANVRIEMLDGREFELNFDTFEQTETINFDSGIVSNVVRFDSDSSNVDVDLHLLSLPEHDHSI